MIANRNHEHNGPLTWVGRLPVYLATAITAVLGVSMIATSLALALGGADLVGALTFTYASAIQNLQLWQFVTYSLVNPPSIGLVIQLFMFAWFGTEVEKFLGRRSFALLCTLLLLAMPALLSIMGAFGVDLPMSGSGEITFAIFMAFAIIYPRAEILFSIEARWIAIILMGVNTLQCLAFHAWANLIMLWWGLAVVAAWLKFEGLASLETPSVSDYFRRKHSEKKLTVVRPRKEEKTAKQTEVGVHDSIDPILEKIARQGIGSLSRGEREKLERARAALLEKERGH
jgi:hypothetical protein